MDEAVEWAERFPFEAWSSIYPGEYGADVEIEIRQVFEPGVRNGPGTVVDAGVIYVNAHSRSDARVVEDLQDPQRTEPPFLLGERAMLEAWLEFHRTTLLLKCEGLADAGRKGRAVPTSKLSLHGLVRHLAEVERSWFRRVLLDDRLAPPIWYDPAVEDSELVPLDDADWEADLAAWQAECDVSRAAAGAHALDDTGLRHGEPCSLRWIYVHMIEEYARHNGHADLIRELVDGRVGW